ncbi:MAG: cysteine desulfurase family protein [Parvibaculaceae bacterium]|nr:cysteine desulfurase family protein [Parvibaculaceae bacterium]
MNTARSYFDHNATAPVLPEAMEAVVRALEMTGNASSVHGEGRSARRIVEEARGDIAALFGIKPSGVTFTSGGTEAANLAIHIAVRALGVTRLIVSSIEHDAVRASAASAGVPVRLLPVTGDGVADMAALAGLLAEEGGKALVALMLANNETGVIQPVAEAAKLAHGAGGLLFADAVQGAGKLDIEFAGLGADMAAVSAHKIGGPMGVGAMAMRPGLAAEPLIRGGGQEFRRRAGTENVPGIAGFAAAARVAGERRAGMPDLERLRGRLETGLAAVAPDLVVFGAKAARLSQTSLFSAPGLDAEKLVIALDLDGFAVSSGSACSSGKVIRSHVLSAMGVDDDLARGAIRVSLGPGNRDDEIDRLVKSWGRAYARFRTRWNETGAPAERRRAAGVEY